MKEECMNSNDDRRVREFCGEAGKAQIVRELAWRVQAIDDDDDVCRLLDAICYIVGVPGMIDGHGLVAEAFMDVLQVLELVPAPAEAGEE